MSENIENRDFLTCQSSYYTPIARKEGDKQIITLKWLRLLNNEEDESSNLNFITWYKEETQVYFTKYIIFTAPILKH